MNLHFTWLVLLASVALSPNVALSQRLPAPETQVTRESFSPVPLPAGNAAGVLPRTDAFGVARERLDRRIATGGGAKDHRWLGAAIGAVGVGVAAGAFTYLMCGMDEDSSCAKGTQSCVKGSVLTALPSAAVGAGVGAMIGSAFPRDTVRVPPR